MQTSGDQVRVRIATEVPHGPDTPTPTADSDGTPTPRRRRVTTLMVVVALAAAFVALAITLTGSSGTPTRLVVFRLTGAGKAGLSGAGYVSITYTTATDATAVSPSEARNVLPWRYAVRGPGPLSAYTIWAQNEAGASLTCTMTVDGRLDSTNVAIGADPTVYCRGR